MPARVPGSHGGSCPGVRVGVTHGPADRLTVTAGSEQDCVSPAELNFGMKIRGQNSHQRRHQANADPSTHPNVSEEEKRMVALANAFLQQVLIFVRHSHPVPQKLDDEIQVELFVETQLGLY